MSIFLNFALLQHSLKQTDIHRYYFLTSSFSFCLTSGLGHHVTEGVAAAVGHVIIAAGQGRGHFQGHAQEVILQPDVDSARIVDGEGITTKHVNIKEDVSNYITLKPR